MKCYQTLPILNINILLSLLWEEMNVGSSFLQPSPVVQWVAVLQPHTSYGTSCKLLPSNTPSKFKSPISQQHCHLFWVTHMHSYHLWYHSGCCDPWAKPYIFTHFAASSPYFPRVFRMVMRSFLCSQLCLILHVPPLWRRLPTTHADLEKPCSQHGFSRFFSVTLHWSSFLCGPLCVCVCVCVLHYSAGKSGVSIAWPILTGILFVRGIGRNWTAGLVTAGCLAVQLRLWHSWYTFRTSLTWNDIAWLSCFVTFSVKNQFRYFAGSQHPWPLTWSTHCATNHKDCEVLTGENNKLPVQHHRCKLSTKSEKLSAIYEGCSIIYLPE
jgi:hypothetical protein